MIVLFHSIVYCLRWSLWFLKADKTKEWKENLKLVISFDTVSHNV